MFFSNHLSCFVLSQVDNLLKFQHLSNLLKCQHLRKASKLLFRIFLLLNFIRFLILFFIYLHFPGQPFTEPVINAGEFMIRLIFPIFIFPSLVCFFIYFLSFFL